MSARVSKVAKPLLLRHANSDSSCVSCLTCAQLSVKQFKTSMANFSSALDRGDVFAAKRSYITSRGALNAFVSTLPDEHTKRHTDH